MDKSSRLGSAESDLPAGVSYSPVNGRSEESPERGSRWSVVAVCALSACLASLQAGMSLSFSSIVIDQLNKSSVSYTDDWKPIRDDGGIASMIGVSGDISNSVFKVEM